ncbi:MAG: glutamyl-tRNA reductase, partial [Mycobacteriales bacterium]
SALVCGAGSMARLAVSTLHRAGIVSIVIANRSPEAARQLAATVSGRSAGLDDLATELAGVDIVVSATAAGATVVPASAIEKAMSGRSGRPLFVLDLAMPRDVDPLSGAVDGVTVVDLETLSAALADPGMRAEIEAARTIVAAEVVKFLAAQRSGDVAPTVTALRSRAAALVDAELARLASRLPDLDPATRAELEATVRRVVATLLHTPTVRVKELATAPGGDTYAQALRELFELDPAATEAVARAALPVPEDAL